MNRSSAADPIDRHAKDIARRLTDATLQERVQQLKAAVVMIREEMSARRPLQSSITFERIVSACRDEVRGAADAAWQNLWCGTVPDLLAHLLRNARSGLRLA